jgi:inner membrane protein
MFTLHCKVILKPRERLMNDTPMLLSSLQSRLKTRSMGMKLIVVCGLALAMTIPALFVEGLVEERTQRAADVTREIANHVGGQQTFLGPTLAIPYTVPHRPREVHPSTAPIWSFLCRGEPQSKLAQKSDAVRFSRSLSSKLTYDSTLRST